MDNFIWLYWICYVIELKVLKCVIKWTFFLSAISQRYGCSKPDWYVTDDHKCEPQIRQLNDLIILCTLWSKAAIND